MKQLVKVKRIATIECYVDRESYRSMTDDEIRDHEMDITDDEFIERFSNEFEIATNIDTTTVVTFENIV